MFWRSIDSGLGRLRSLSQGMSKSARLHEVILVGFEIGFISNTWRSCTGQLGQVAGWAVICKHCVD